MANTQATFGFKPIGYLSGGSPDFQLSTRAISKTNATAIGFGDPVVRVNATSPYITQGAASTSSPIEGIFQGCYYIPTGGGAPVWSPGWPGVTVAADATAYIIDAPNAQFLVATLLTSITTGQIGQVVNYNIGTASTTGAMMSGATIDQSTATSTALGTTYSGQPFRIVNVYGGTGNFGGVGNGTDTTTNYNWVIVGFNNQINRTLGGF